MRDWKIEQSFKTIRECEDFRHNVATATLVLETIRIARALAGEIEIDPNTEMGHIADVLAFRTIASRRCAIPSTVGSLRDRRVGKV
jgi:hypothetical protein